MDQASQYISDYIRYLAAYNDLLTRVKDLQLDEEYNEQDPINKEIIRKMNEMKTKLDSEYKKIQEHLMV